MVNANSTFKITYAPPDMLISTFSYEVNISYETAFTPVKRYRNTKIDPEAYEDLGLIYGGVFSENFQRLKAFRKNVSPWIVRQVLKYASVKCCL